MVATFPQSQVPQGASAGLFRLDRGGHIRKRFALGIMSRVNIICQVIANDQPYGLGLNIIPRRSDSPRLAR